MVIDLILDRKDFDEWLEEQNATLEDYKEYYNSLTDEVKVFRTKPYNARDFYFDIMRYNDDHYFDYILKALDEGSNKDIQNALAKYIIDGEYNPNIIDYINSKNWLEGAENE